MQLKNAKMVKVTFGVYSHTKLHLQPEHSKLHQSDW